MKLGLILVLVALLVPTVLWLVLGDAESRALVVGPVRYVTLTDFSGDPVVVREQPSGPFRYVLACAAICAAVGIYLLATRKPR